MKEFKSSFHSYQEILEEYYQLRLKKNPNYSLGALARDLEISLAQLSSILKGRRGLSLTAGEKIAEKLNLPEAIKEIFLDDIQSKHSRNYIQKKAAEIRINARKNADIFFVKEDIFKIVSDWQHFAIIEFMSITGFKNDETWIAKNLGIPLNVCRESIERLFRVGLLQEKEGQWITTGNYVMGPDEIKSEAIKKFHQQILSKANEALDYQSLENREFGSVLFTMCTSDLPEAKQMLKDFRKKFSRHFRGKENRDSLYSLSMQFFKLDKKLTEEFKTGEEKVSTASHSPQ